jgi:hypothetical protein
MTGARTWATDTALPWPLAALGPGDYIQQCADLGRAGHVAKRAVQDGALKWMMVLAAARLPSSRSVSASSAVRSTPGSLRKPTGSDACRAQSRICAAGLSGSPRRAGLKACWYKTMRSSRGSGR